MYIRENRKTDRYILPPLTLNVQQEARLYTAESESSLKTGFLVIPATAKLAITDGQHRRSGIIKALSQLSFEDAQELEADGIAAMITCETNIDQIHQDFADCSKTKQLPASQLAVYDRRNPANRLVIEIERKCRLFHGRIDATSKTLGKKSTSLFLANQIRQMVKVLLTGSWQMADKDFEVKAKELLERNPATYDQEPTRFVNYIEYLTDTIAVWRQIASLGPGVESAQIPVLRQEGYICLSVTGLVILGFIGHELFRQKEPNWKHFVDMVGKIDWRKDAEIWQGNVVSERRILIQQKHIRDATQKVRMAIGWKPRPDAAFRASSAPDAEEPSGVDSTSAVHTNASLATSAS